MTITLYQYPGRDGLPSVSPPCVKIHLALTKMGLEYKVKNLQSPAAVKKKSSTGRVPAIELNGKIINDSVAILDALEAAFPDHPLSPTDPALRARDRVWELFANDSLYWLGVYMRFCHPGHARRFLDRALGHSFFLRRIIGPLFVVPSIRKRARMQGTGMRSLEEVKKAHRRSLELIRDGLEGGPFLGGQDAPGRGDMMTSAMNIQGPYGDMMPEAWALMTDFPEVLAHTTRTFEACGVALPDYWKQAVAAV